MNDDETGLLIAAIEQICGGDPKLSQEDNGEEEYDERSWQLLEQSDFTLVSIPTDLGGSGGNLQQAAAVTRAAGRMGLAAPVVETVWSAAWLLAASEIPVPRGPLTATMVDPAHATLASTPEGWRLDGVLHGVPWAAAADLVVALAPVEGRPKVVRLDPERAEVRSGFNLAGEPRNDVVCSNVLLAENEVTAAGDDVTPTRLGQRSALGRVVAMSGAAERVMELATVQAKERQQFGRRLARFQAVQQLLARLVAETASVLVAAQAAVLALEHETSDAAGFAIASAKASGSRSAGSIAALGHQVMGALGLTMEHPLQRSTRRLWAWREECGNERQHHLDLARRALACDNPWRLIADGSVTAIEH
jgi:acyl-CoA dehydrogenase